LYVGTAVTNTASDYFAHLDPAQGRTHTIQSQAVAEVSRNGSSGTSGSSSPNPTAACEICIFGNVTFQASSDTLQAGGGNIDVGGYVYFDSSSDALKTSAGSGWGIAIDGTSTYNGYTVEYTGSSDSLSSAGILGIDGNVYFNSSSDSIAATGTLNISGTVKNNGSSNTISPASYGTATTAAFTDPLAATPAPSYTVNGKTFAAPTYAVSGDTTDFPNNGNWSYPTSGCPSSDTINPGIYDSIIINCSSATLNFNPGVYVIDGDLLLDQERRPAHHQRQQRPHQPLGRVQRQQHPHVLRPLQQQPGRLLRAEQQHHLHGVGNLLRPYRGDLVRRELERDPRPADRRQRHVRQLVVHPRDRERQHQPGHHDRRVTGQSGQVTGTLRGPGPRGSRRGDGELLRISRRSSTGTAGRGR